MGDTKEKMSNSPSVGHFIYCSMSSELSQSSWNLKNIWKCFSSHIYSSLVLKVVCFSLSSPRSKHSNLRKKIQIQTSLKFIILPYMFAVADLPMSVQKYLAPFKTLFKGMIYTKCTNLVYG